MRNLICGVHNWDYRYDTGVSEYANDEVLHKFGAWIDADEDAVFVDASEVRKWEEKNAQPYDRDRYLGLYADLHGTSAEPHNSYIQRLARGGIEGVGHHGPVSAMGVPLTELPRWDDIQILTAQLATRPLVDEDPVGTDVVIGPKARKPLRLDIPLFVSDMSFGSLSEEAKVALATGAEMAGTGICSGEGGDAPGGAGGELPVLLRAGLGSIRMEPRKGVPGAGLSFQGGTGSQDRNGRPPSGT